MTGESAFGDRLRRAADRVGAWFAAKQSAVFNRWLEVPASLRTGLRRAFALAFLTVIAWVLYRQLKGTDWEAVLHALPASPWFYLLVFARFWSLAPQRYPPKTSSSSHLPSALPTRSMQIKHM